MWTSVPGLKRTRQWWEWQKGRRCIAHRHLHSCSLAVNGFIFLATCQLPVCLSIHLFVQTSILITTLTKFHRGCYRYQAELQGPCNVSAAQCSNSHGYIRTTPQILSSATTHRKTLSLFSVPLWPPLFPFISLPRSLLISLVPSPLHWLSVACQKPRQKPFQSVTHCCR